MSNPRVIKFGTISASGDGLIFQGFHIDADDCTEGHAVITLRAVIARLQEEIEKLNAITTDPNVGYDFPSRNAAKDQS
jgi:hypothetical protein